MAKLLSQSLRHLAVHVLDAGVDVGLHTENRVRLMVE